jgi:hypothetical protein
MKALGLFLKHGRNRLNLPPPSFQMWVLWAPVHTNFQHGCNGPIPEPCDTYVRSCKPIIRKFSGDSVRGIIKVNFMTDRHRTILQNNHKFDLPPEPVVIDVPAEKNSTKSQLFTN